MDYLVSFVVVDMCVCRMIGKFSETYRQPVSSLPAVEDTHPVGYASVREEPPRGTSRQPRPTVITVTEPESVPGLDVQCSDNQPKRQCVHDTAAVHATPRKESSTQTGKSLGMYVGINFGLVIVWHCVWILNLDRSYWALAFACFHFFFLYIFAFWSRVLD